MKPSYKFYNKAHDLLLSQKINWEALRKGYESLSLVETKNIQFDDYYFTVQYNPQRITSTAARTDTISIKERNCFLCSENRPAEQEEIDIDGFYVLCNPFPIFSEHFTITSKEHIPQSIKDSFSSLLKFSEYFREHLAVFYNGPECGASAPDHLHFQAGTINEFPLISQISKLVNAYGKRLISFNSAKNNSTEVFAVNDGLRKMLFLKSNNTAELENAFNTIYAVLEKDSASSEPKLNIISSYNKGWEVIIFIREKHRPEQFFYEGEEKITFSPAAVDCGGLCITPVEKDYKLFDKNLLTNCFNQVFISDEKFSQLVNQLESCNK